MEGRILTAFDTAWALLKMPWQIHDDEGYIGDEDFDLYSGGDVDDESPYWTPHLHEALAYALFGSAIHNANWRVDNQKGLVGNVPMRQTRPRVQMARSPYSDIPIMRDPQSDGFIDTEGEISDRAFDLNEDFMDILLNHAIMTAEKGRNIQASNATTARHHAPEDILAHLQAALQRYEQHQTHGRVPPPPPLPEQFHDLVETSDSDVHFATKHGDAHPLRREEP